MPCLLIDLLSVAKVRVSGKKKKNTQCAFPSRESWDIGAGHRSSSILPLAPWTKWERVWRCTIWIPKLWDLVKIWKWRGRQWKKENWLSTYWILVYIGHYRLNRNLYYYFYLQMRGWENNFSLVKWAEAMICTALSLSVASSLSLFAEGAGH